jgi:inosose dehydratase
MARTNVQAAAIEASRRFAGRSSCGLVLCPPRDLPGAAGELATAGFTGVELHPAHIDALADPSFRARVLGSLADAGLEVACVNVGVVGDELGAALAGSRCLVAASAGSELIFALPPSRRAATLVESARHLRSLCDRADELGLDVALHHHAGTSVETLAEIEEVAARVDHPRFGICFDSAHFALFESDLPAGTRALGSRISYVHLKDLAADRPALVAGADTLESVLPLTPAYTDLGAGSLDLHATLDALASVGYAGWLTIEMETLRGPSFVEQARANAASLSALLGSL